MLYPIWVSMMWVKVAVKVIYMPFCQGKYYLVAAKKYFSGWVEVCAFAKANSTLITQFLWENVICRHGIFGQFIIDDKRKNKAKIIKLIQHLEIKRLIVSTFHPQANKIVECKYKPIVNTFIKIINKSLNN